MNKQKLIAVLLIAVLAAAMLAACAGEPQSDANGGAFVDTPGGGGTQFTGEVYDFNTPIEIWELSDPVTRAGENTDGFNGLWLNGGLYRDGNLQREGEYDPELDAMNITDGVIIYALYYFDFATFAATPWADDASLARFAIQGYVRTASAAVLTTGTFAIETASGGWSYLFLMPIDGPVTDPMLTVGPPADAAVDYVLFSGAAR